MPSPVCTVDGNATPVDVSSSGTSTIALANPSGVQYWSITCSSTDDTNTTAAVNASLVVNQATKTATFTRPAIGSALIFQSVVGVLNLGLDANGTPQSSYTTTFEVHVKTAGGFRVMAVSEGLESNATFGWTTKLNTMIRGGTPPGGAAGGDLAGSSYPSPFVASISGGGGVGGTVPVSAILQIGVSALTIAASVTSPTWGQNTTTGATGANWTLQAQASSAATGTGGNMVLAGGAAGGVTSGTPGNVVASIPAPTGAGAFGQFQVSNAAHVSFLADNQGVVLGRTDASQCGVRIAPLIGQENGYTGFWTGANATSPNGSNYTIALGSTGAAGGFWSTGSITFGGGNQFVFTMSTSTTANFSMAAGVLSPLWFQSNTAGATGTNWTFTAQGSTQASGTTTGGSFVFNTGIVTAGSNGTAGNFTVNIGSPTGTGSEAGFQVQRAGSTLVRLQQTVGTANTGAVYLGTITPSATNVALYGDGSSATILNAPGSSAFVGVLINGSNYMARFLGGAGLTLFSSSDINGGGVGALGMANATTLPTSAPSGGGVVAHDGTTHGLHYYAPTTFLDYAFTPLFTGTANTQANKFRTLWGAGRTTTNAAVTILNLPAPISGSVASYLVCLQGRDQASGTVGDGISFWITVQIKNVGGVVTAATGTSNTQLSKNNDTSLAACTFSLAAASGTNIPLQATGLAATTIDWTAWGLGPNT